MNKISELSFEKFLGIHTSEDKPASGEDFGQETSITAKIGGRTDTGTNYSYAASEYDGLVKVFERVSLTKEDTLVDIGCGKGRVLFFCNQKFMCHVTGIEYDRKIFEKLKENAAYYHVRFKNQEDKFHLFNIKAEDYDIQPHDNFFYMFNPFSKDILAKILDKIVRSVKCSPRRATVILYYCTYEMMEAMRNTPFELKEIIKLRSYKNDPDEKVYIYEWKP